MRLVEVGRLGVRRIRATGIDDGLRLVEQAGRDERLDRDGEGLEVRREAVDAVRDLPREPDGLVEAAVREPQPDLRRGVVDHVLEVGALGRIGERRPGVVQPPELEQDLRELDGRSPPDLRARGPQGRPVRRLDGVEGSEQIPTRAADPARRDPDHLDENGRPGLRLERVDAGADARHHQVQSGPGLVVRDVLCDERIAGPLRLLEALVQRLHRLDRAARVDQCECDPRLGPHALEPGSGRPRDLDRLRRHLEAVVVVELELVEPGQPDVRERELGRRAVLLEDASRVLGLLEGQVGTALLPAAASQHEPGARGFELLPEALEARDALHQHLFRRGGLPVHPEHLSHVGEQARPLERVADVRKGAVEELERLGERERRLRLLGRLDALRHRLVEASRSEQVARDLQGLRAGVHEHVGRAAVDLLAAREHDLVRDGLLRQRVPPPVRGAPGVDLLQQLLRHADRERVVHGRVGNAGDADERGVVERPSQHGRGLEDLDVGRVEAREPQQDRVADGLGNAQLLQAARLPAVIRADDVAAVDRLLEHLLEDEGVSLRP